MYKHEAYGKFLHSVGRLFSDFCFQAANPPNASVASAGGSLQLYPEPSSLANPTSYPISAPPPKSSSASLPVPPLSHPLYFWGDDGTGPTSQNQSKCLLRHLLAVPLLCN